MAMNKCIKLFLILVFVGAVAFGVTFLPFNLSDKFKAVVDKVSSHLRGLGGMGSDEKVRLDFSKRDSYTHGNLNVVLDKADNVPKDGYLKFIHKGEKDLPLDVEGFTLGDTTLEGVEPGLLDYAAGYFKGESPHLLLVELCLHNKGDGDNGNGEGNKDETKKGENEPKGTEGGKGNGPGDKTEGEKVFYCPGENNKWVKLADGADLGAKVDEVFSTLSANTPPTGTPDSGVVTTPVLPATPLPGNQNLDFPKGESPVPAPQNYPLTGPGATNAAAPLPLGGPPTGGQQPGTGAPVALGTPGTDGATGTGNPGTGVTGPTGTPTGPVAPAGPVGTGTGAPGGTGLGGPAGPAGPGVPGGAGVSEPGRNGLTGETGAQGGVSSVGQGTHSVPSGLGEGVVEAGGVGPGVGVGGVGGAGGAGSGAPGKTEAPPAKVPGAPGTAETTTGAERGTGPQPAGTNTVNQNQGTGENNGQNGSNGGGSGGSSGSPTDRASGTST